MTHWRLRYNGPVMTKSAPPTISRRQLFIMAAAGLLWPQNREEMIVRSTRPEDLEMPASGFTGFITPSEQFFVRTHVGVPRVDIAEWRLKVDGHISAPLTLSMDDLRKMRSVELVGVLECAGNGRSFFNPPVPGLQWTNGAVGNGLWRGVRLADVLQLAGVKPGAVEIFFDGADIPLGTMADFQRSIPLNKALDRDTLLAYEMNGEPLPVKHGFPLRVVVPGWAGDSWVKWVTSIRVLNEEWRGFWMKDAYRYPLKPAAPGVLVPPEATKPVTSLRVKSVITYPERYARLDVKKRAVIRGVAWTGDAGTITRVDVSVDEGHSWNSARLTGAATRFGWRLWEFPWTPSADRHYTVLARARDSSGAIQPLDGEWNPSGYLWNGIARVDVWTGSAPGAPPSADPAPPLPPPPGFRETCLGCHDADVIRQQRLTRAQWNRELDKMMNWGARLQPQDRETFLDYLSKGP
jgi:DMSO/TMAO reductase YedYZ molybdopterin-dependent catalytic subunit